MKYSASAQLWVGNPDIVKNAALKLIQNEYCSNKSFEAGSDADHCGRCCVCKHIEQQQHHATLIIATEKSTYSRSDLDLIFSKITLSRSEREPFFCVITQADKLSSSCANSLLKLLEEPPCGWHWILLTDRLQEVMPTIVSRCVVTPFASERSSRSYEELYGALSYNWRKDLIHFGQLLDRSKITDYESKLLLDDLLAFWSADQKQRELVHYLYECLEYQPMPGSSKFFWRTVYLKMCSLLG